MNAVLLVVAMFLSFGCAEDEVLVAEGVYRTSSEAAIPTGATESERLSNRRPARSLLELRDRKRKIMANGLHQDIFDGLDALCSAKLPVSNALERSTPDINDISFMYVTPCKNYSLPLQEAHQLARNSNFDKTKKVAILAHGWINTIDNSEFIRMMSQALLCRKDVNFVIVDVGYYLRWFYIRSALRTEEIGKHIAVGLAQLVQFVPLQNIHLIGHSLGAHVMGAAGRHFTKSTGKLIPRITGLDPAKPCFESNEILLGLRRGDAQFIDIIHSNNGVLGKADPIGDVDFYPGGTNALPPGCHSSSCAHGRSWEYFTESAYPQNEYSFLGYKCNSWSALEQENCHSSITSPMGYIVDTNAKGLFYVDVNGDSPYGPHATQQTVGRPQCHICSEP